MYIDYREALWIGKGTDMSTTICTCHTFLSIAASSFKPGKALLHWMEKGKTFLFSWYVFFVCATWFLNRLLFRRCTRLRRWFARFQFFFSVIEDTLSFINKIPELSVTQSLPWSDRTTFKEKYTSKRLCKVSYNILHVYTYRYNTGFPSYTWQVFYEEFALVGLYTLLTVSGTSWDERGSIRILFHVWATPLEPVHSFFPWFCIILHYESLCSPGVIFVGLGC